MGFRGPGVGGRAYGGWVPFDPIGWGWQGLRRVCPWECRAGLLRGAASATRLPDCPTPSEHAIGSPVCPAGHVVSNANQKSEHSPVDPRSPTRRASGRLPAPASRQGHLFGVETRPPVAVEVCVSRIGRARTELPCDCVRPWPSDRFLGASRVRALRCRSVAQMFEQVGVDLDAEPRRIGDRDDAVPRRRHGAGQLVQDQRVGVRVLEEHRVGRRG